MCNQDIHSRVSCPRPILHKPQCIVWPSLPHIQPRGVVRGNPQHRKQISSCSYGSSYHHIAQSELQRFMVAQLQKAEKLKRQKMTSCSFMFFPRFSFKIKRHYSTLTSCDLTTLHHSRGLGNVPSCWRMEWECPPETATTTESWRS